MNRQQRRAQERREKEDKQKDRPPYKRTVKAGQLLDFDELHHSMGQEPPVAYGLPFEPLKLFRRFRAWQSLKTFNTRTFSLTGPPIKLERTLTSTPSTAALNTHDGLHEAAQQSFPRKPLASALPTVFWFPFKNLTYQGLYDHPRLIPGSIVHVTFVGYQGAAIFTEQPGPHSQAYCVLGGRPEHRVMLRSQPASEEMKYLILRLCKELDTLIPQPVVMRAIRKLASAVPVKDLHRKDKYEKTALAVLEAVLDRLDLCDRLSHQALTPALEHHQLMLVIYLYLTCFDLLGQPAPWMTFDAWLSSSGTKEERAEAEALLAPNASPVETARHFLQAYNTRYGVKSSFYRFIDDLLEEEDRAALFGSMLLLSSALTMPPDNPQDATPEEKKKYLFNLRNSYTHRARYAPGVTPQMNPSDAPELPPAREMFTHYEQYIDARHAVSVLFRDWPNAIRRAVRHGLVQYLKTL